MASVPPPPDHPDLTTAVRQANEAYRAGRLEEAAQSCTTAIALDSGHFDAHHLAGLVKLAQGDVPQAIRFLTEAVKLNARSAEAANDLGRAFHRAGDDVAAVVQHERALALNPVYPPALAGLAAAQHALGWREDALRSYRSALTYRPGFAEALNGCAAVLLGLGRAEEALESATAALAADPRCVEAHLNRGNIFGALDRHQRALASYDEALRLRPDYAEALAAKSAIFSLLNRHDEALAAADAALAIDSGHVNALVNRGVAAQQLGRLEEAVAAYDRALAAAPEHVAALSHRAAAARDLGCLDAALASFTEVVALAPDDVEALTGRGNLLRRLGRHDEALASFEKALTITPANGYVLGSAAREALSVCDWSKAERWGQDIAARIEQGKPMWPGVVPALSDSPSLQALAARNFVRDRVRISVRPPSSALRNHDRIRLAYVAANDFAAVAAGAIAALAARHDRTAFDVIGLSFGGAGDGERRGALSAAFDQFHDVTARTDAAAARLLRELEVDIAVDLEGYTEDARPGIFAARPAPVQVSFGYPATLGADFIDYIMADKIVLPFDEQKTVSERIVQLPDCHRVIDNRHEPVPEPPSREAAALPGSGIVFCCFAETYKVGRPVFDAWMRLLSGSEGSVLWLAPASDGASGRLRSAASDRGVDPARLVFAPPVPRAEHLSRHRLADIFLDTYPFGAATAADALWADVPVVTCKGSAFSARTGASVVAAVGQSELVAADLTGYEALALRLAAEPERLADCKRHLAEQRSAAPLFDLDRFRRQVEAAYFKMHGLACSGAPPQSFAVNAG
jgi:predicted O-linked N-acetylglucosamine transferase (SPINDLY family)